jgi:cation diffusion facilitator CzcD-associated flavoprotein CzcO
MAGVEFDPEALRARYLAERDKRWRPEGVAQYVPTTLGAEHSDFADDPHADPQFWREPLSDEVDVVVVGGGIAGVLVAARLKEAGVSGVRIIEKAADFGGTWYFNRYPGLRCDIESYIYMPLLEETGYIPTEKYARGREIFEHFQRIARHYDLYRDACLQTRVTALNWDEGSARWIVSTDRGDAIRARFISLGGGNLHRPKLPGIPGLDEFQGRMFHTSRWDYDYTGGDTTGNLTKLADKRVAVIGTGATGIQVVPNVARYAQHLYVFQRTPSTVDVRNNRPTDPEWAASLTPGWQKRRMDNFNALLIGQRQEEDLVADGWTDVARKLALFSAAAAGEQSTPEMAQYADYAKMEELRSRVSSIVADAATAESLKPWYNYMCKRPCFSDEYLQAFNRPNVTLVDTDGHGPDRITAHAIEYAGVSYEVDCLIFATGFDAVLPVYESNELELNGRDGLPLAKRWQHGGVSLHGILVGGFPNMFISGNKAYAATTANGPHILDDQAVHVAALIKRCLDDGVRSMEVKPEAEARWIATVDQTRVDRTKFFEECTPGYYNFEGAKGRSALSLAYSPGPFEYVEVCRRWRETRFTEDLDLTYED